MDDFKASVESVVERLHKIKFKNIYIYQHTIYKYSYIEKNIKG